MSAFSISSKSSSNFLSVAFPPPQFLRMPRVSLEISSNSIRFLEIVSTKNGPLLGRFGERKIPEGVGYSEEVQTKKELKDTLLALKNECKLKFVNVTLPEEKAYLFQVTFPEVDERQMRENVEIVLEENVPMSGSEVIFDCSVIRKWKDEKGSHVDVGVSVIPKTLVENFLELFKSVGLVPLSFELGAEAVARAMVKEGDMDTYMIVNLGEKKTGIYIVNLGKVHFTTTLNFGGGALTSGIMKLFGVTEEEAVKIKKGKDFIKNKENMRLFFSLLNPISALKDEINRLSIFWNTHKNARGETNQKIKKILLCGADSHLPGLTEYLSLTLKTETEVGNVWVNLFSFEKNIPELSFADSLNYPAVIGLSLE